MEFLFREGFSVSVACNGSEALREFLHRRFDCSVMDVNMPGLNGPEVLHRLVASGHPQGVPPTVFVSSDLSAAQMIKNTLAQLSEAPVGFLPKPVRLEALRRSLELVLARGRMGPPGPTPPASA